MSTPATKEISDWLEKLGMSEYIQRFSESDCRATIKVRGERQSG